MGVLVARHRRRLSFVGWLARRVGLLCIWLAEVQAWLLLREGRRRGWNTEG